MTFEQVFELQNDQAVTVNGRAGTVDRVSGCDEIFVWFGEFNPDDPTMRVGVIGYQPAEVELVS